MPWCQGTHPCLPTRARPCPEVHPVMSIVPTPRGDGRLRLACGPSPQRVGRHSLLGAWVPTEPTCTSRSRPQPSDKIRKPPHKLHHLKETKKKIELQSPPTGPRTPPLSLRQLLRAQISQSAAQIWRKEVKKKRRRKKNAPRHSTLTFPRD